MKHGRLRNRSRDRDKVLADIQRLARQAIQGSISETYRTCGNAGCRCHVEGPKHGPHMYVSYRGSEGKTTGFYVPQAAHDGVRRGVIAWQELKSRLRDLAELNREIVLARARQGAARDEP